MSYEINVAKKGKHFFATTERSANSPSEVIHLYSVIADKFPESEGYSITVSRVSHSSKDITASILSGTF